MSGMTAVQRPGWHKPYVGCINWGFPDLPHAAVVYRGTSALFDTWAEAIEYATGFVRMQQSLRDARIARRQAREAS